MDNNEYLKYSVNLPYPEIKVERKNPQYAELLQDDYAGIVSELTAITQYTYHHFVSGDINKEVSDLVKGIARVEMKHLELLGEAIIKLGGDPLFRGSFSNRGQFWNGYYVSYSKTIKRILLDNIDAEKKAILQYKRHIELIHDPNIQKLLQRIILDEEYHLTLFTNMLQKGMQD